VLLIGYIKNNGGIDVLINVNTFLNYYINSFGSGVGWFYVIIVTIIFLD